MNDIATTNELELNISRLVPVSPDHIYRCWTEPELLVKWFTPQPWKTLSCEIDLRTGGAFNTLMKGPDGPEFPHQGIFLEIIPNRKVVFTDALLAGWTPSAKPFVVATVTFEPENGQTRYTARVWHWTAADRDSHLQMGFHGGWNKALDQLLEVAAAL